VKAEESANAVFHGFSKSLFFFINNKPINQGNIIFLVILGILENPRNNTACARID